MRAVQYDRFGSMPVIVELPAPEAPADGVVVTVRATGVCRSDWHAWKGHDDSVALPHVPGHEFSGIVAAVGSDVSGFAVGDRVTAPFVFACGTCEQCRDGATQVCTRQQQPGFTLPGSYAESVVVPHADVNLVALLPRWASPRRRGSAAGSAPPTTRCTLADGSLRGSGSRSSAAAVSVCPPSWSPWQRAHVWSPSTSRRQRSNAPRPSARPPSRWVRT